MKILFIVPFDHVSFLHGTYIMPLGLISLATILKENNKDVEIIDFNYLFFNNIVEYSKDQGKNMETMAEYILGKSPDIIGFTCVSVTFHHVLFLSRLIKNKNNNIKIISGGPQASNFSEKILENFPWIDLICRGEGEHKILHIIKGLETDDLTDVPGIIYRNNDIISENADIPLIEDMDTLPLLNYALSPGGYEGKISMEISRGCPYNCIFCSTSKYWKRKFRVKSIERICREISLIKEAIPDNHKLCINFIDDNFTTNHNFIMNLCAELRKFDITWTCNGRLNTLNEELIKQMALSGCRSVFMGIESGSPRVQKYINKNLNLEKVNSIFDTILKYNIKPTVSFVYGFPGETEEELNLTLNMIYSLLKKGVYLCRLHSLCVITGTKLFEDHKDNLILGNLMLKDFYSDPAEGANFEDCRALIMKDKKLFPHFYTLKDSLCEKYSMLDKFVNFIFKLYNFFPETITSLVSLFNDDILSFHKDFLSNTQKFADFYNNNEHLNIIMKDGSPVKNSELGKQVIIFLTEYINNKSLSDFSFNIISHKFCEEIDHKAGKISLLPAVQE